MRNIKISFWVLLIGLTALWLLADTFFPQPMGYFPLRKVLVQYSGVIAMGSMSVLMVLAARPSLLEPWFGGLDKMYRLHKWLGIAALVFGTVHWLWAKGTKWAVGWGWLVKPGKGARPDYTGIEQIFRSQRGFAEWLGEWGFYIAAALIILALIKRFPYRLFTKTHTVLAALYLVLVYHTIILLNFEYWTQPIGLVMALLMAAGSVAAIMSLFKQIGAKRKAYGQICDLHYDSDARTLKTAVKMQSNWPGHEAGQFAFVTFDRKEGAHPYTIASAWDPQSRQITFLTKSLGDYTSTMPDLLHVGSSAIIEGPYGCFTFDTPNKRQIWIGAGIGITPFIARMEQLARQPGHDYEVDLYHPTADFSASTLAHLQQLAKDAGVRLHLLVDAADGRLDGPRLRTEITDWQQAGIWFCGPAQFGKSLRDDLVGQGFKSTAFHQELFQMR